MTPTSRSDNPNLRKVVRGLLELHRLAAAGKNESDEADAVRDFMDAPWACLSEAEKARATGLSEDLYSLSEVTRPEARQEMNPQAQAKLAEAFEAWKKRDWDRSLTLLRRWRDHISAAVASHIRGGTWLELGFPEVAALFLQHASDLDPENARYQAAAIVCLSVADPPAGVRRAEEVLAEPGAADPVVLLRCAWVLYKTVETAAPGAARQTLSRLVLVLEKVVSSLAQDTSEDRETSEIVSALTLLGACHEGMENYQAALKAYSEGLQIDPYNGELLVARGILLYGADRSAVADFERAVRTGVDGFWPYFFLAHSYLLTGRFEECRRMCERALDLAPPAAARSELLDWMAMAEAEMGFPTGMVRRRFEESIESDPSNERPRRNLAAFERGKQPGPPPTWEWDRRSEKSVRAFGQAEHRYELAA